MHQIQCLELTLMQEIVIKSELALKVMGWAPAFKPETPGQLYWDIGGGKLYPDFSWDPLTDWASVGPLLDKARGLGFPVVVSSGSGDDLWQVVCDGRNVADSHLPRATSLALALALGIPLGQARR
jgi:hypothetical protein